MKRILKQVITVNDEEQVVPSGKIVHVGRQRDNSPDEIVVWFEEGYGLGQKVLVVGTGHPVEDSSEYLGTVVLDHVPLVWHLVRTGWVEIP